MDVPLKAAGDGWLQWTGEPAANVLVRVADLAGRFTITELRLTAPVTAERLRAVPVGRIEAAANALLRGDAALPADAPATIDPELRSNAVRGYPDAFYVAVAAAYQTLAHTTGRPVAALATANEVPHTTAQRWVREARQRGLLPPGRPGKSG